MKIGFIGLGQMGAGMAANLLKAGHEVVVYNRTASKADALVRLGAQAQHSIEAVCAADTVITMLSDDNALEDVVFGEGGVLASLKKGAVHISSSTISVALSSASPPPTQQRGSIIWPHRCLAVRMLRRTASYSWWLAVPPS
jgi:3-hydroxyisobutyrate dehydrogenase-like beta-hydroxyacid dehydrogenase